MRQNQADARTRPVYIGQMLAIVGIHVTAFAALWYVSWTAFVLAIVLGEFSALGITVGFHRLLTHGGFATSKVMKWLFAFAGLLALQGSVLRWVSDHRKHHQFTDKEGDPHSPRDGWFYAHEGWLFVYRRTAEVEEEIDRYAPDMRKDPFFRMTHDHYWLVPLLQVAALATGGYLYDGWFGLVSFILWGFFVRVTVVWNMTWCVNSLSHICGYRNYATDDDSRNNWFVGVGAQGEGWHNNHHAFPTLAVHGHKWWEIDISYRVIRFLRLIGLVWAVKDTIPRESEA